MSTPTAPSTPPTQATSEYFENTMVAKKLREADYDEFADLVFKLSYLVQGQGWDQVEPLIVKHTLKLTQKP